MSCLVTASFGKPQVGKKPVVMHTYSFYKYDASLRSTHKLSINDTGRFLGLKVNNYSIIHLLALAAGGGRMIPKSNIIVKSAKLKTLDRKMCFQMALHKIDGQLLYDLMLKILQIEFQEFAVTVENKGNQKFLVILDK